MVGRSREEETKVTRRGDEGHEKRRRRSREEETKVTRRGDDLHDLRRRKIPKLLATIRNSLTGLY
jgi:hypothetical protein